MIWCGGVTWGPQSKPQTLHGIGQICLNVGNQYASCMECLGNRIDTTASLPLFTFMDIVFYCFLSLAVSVGGSRVIPVTIVHKDRAVRAMFLLFVMTSTQVVYHIQQVN